MSRPQRSQRHWAGRAAAWICLGVLVGAAGAGRAPAGEQVQLDPASHGRIVNGVTSHAHPTVGALLYSSGSRASADSASTRCTGTLIGCRTFLVAAHCVEDDSNPNHYFVYLQHAGIANVTAVTAHPDSSPGNFPIQDVAVLHLSDWVTGIAPSAINTTDPTSFIPATATIVGFGQTAGTAGDYGIKREGLVQTANCPSGLPSGATNDDVVCWTFAAPLGTPGTHSNTCNGDSGGPLLMNLGAGEVVAGVTSGGMSSDCLPTDVSYDAKVSAAQSYVLGELAGDDTAACGGLPAVGGAQTTVTTYDDTLDGVDTSDSFTVTVPTGANSLRVALNGKDNGTFDADLYVKHGTGAGPGSFDCKADGASVFGACVIDRPAAGTWSLAAVRYAGTGDYQLTATMFGGTAPVCGNGTREFNEACDGADAELCEGLCQGDCTCPAPVCGNDVKEQGEQCDGSADSACPGACGVGCSCPLPCTTGDLFDFGARIDPRNLKFRAKLFNFAGTYDSADPRNGFSLLFTQGSNSFTLSVPANDPGWSGSNAALGRYDWMGSLNGLERVKLKDRSAKQFIWKLAVKGRNIAGATPFNPGLPITVRMTIADRCTEETF